MRTACVVRTRFILNNFSGIGLGVPGPPGPPLATPLVVFSVYIVLATYRNTCMKVILMTNLHRPTRRYATL